MEYALTQFDSNPLPIKSYNVIVSAINSPPMVYLEPHSLLRSKVYTIWRAFTQCHNYI